MTDLTPSQIEVLAGEAWNETYGETRRPWTEITQDARDEWVKVFTNYEKRRRFMENRSKLLEAAGSARHRLADRPHYETERPPLILSRKIIGGDLTLRTTTDQARTVKGLTNSQLEALKEDLRARGWKFFETGSTQEPPIWVYEVSKNGQVVHERSFPSTSKPEARRRVLDLIEQGRPAFSSKTFIEDALH